MKKILISVLIFAMVFSLVAPTYAVTKDKTPPIVKSTNPTSNKSTVSISQTIAINFSENIAKGKTFLNIVLAGQDGFEINYKVKISKNVLSIKPIASLKYNSEYSLKIPTGAIVDNSGNSLKKMFILNFKTAVKFVPTPKPTPLVTTKDIAKNTIGVVYVEVSNKSNQVYASGSRFIVNDKIITNYHVIDKAYYATITTSDGEKYNVTGVYSYDKNQDIAVLKTDATIDLPSLTLGDSSKLELGENVVAIGSPLGLKNTVSQGIISSLRYEIIQMSVPISSGSSGGALFNMKGEVVGVTSSGYIDTSGDLNFAIPINNVKPFLTSSTLQTLSAITAKMYPPAESKITPTPTQTMPNFKDNYISENEPNDTIPNADLLPQNTFALGNLSSSQDKDIYEVGVDQNGNYNIWSTIGTTGEYCGDYYVGLYDYGDNLVAYTKLEYDSATATYSNALYNYYLEQGAYYIWVFPAAGYNSIMASIKYKLVFEKT